MFYLVMYRSVRRTISVMMTALYDRLAINYGSLVLNQTCPHHPDTFILTDYFFKFTITEIGDASRLSQ